MMWLVLTLVIAKVAVLALGYRTLMAAFDARQPCVLPPEKDGDA